MGETSIPCLNSTRERLEQLRGDEYRSWDAFLNALVDGYKSEPGVPRDDGESLSEAANRINETLAASQADTLDYDDVKNACAAAIREELEGRR